MSAKRSRQKNSASANSVVLFGQGADGKSRAASFGASHAKLAVKAAKALKFAVLPIDSELLGALADKLPAGRIHASGLGVVPPVRPHLYEQIVALTSETASSPPPGQQPIENGGHSQGGEKQSKKPRLPLNWESIDAGDLVIAEEDDKTDGWWPAVVVERTGDRFILQWRDYPRQRKFIRQRINLGLFNPGNSDAAEGKMTRAASDDSNSRYPQTWAAIEASHLVLAQDDGPLGAWWPAIVSERNNETTVLRWRNHERLPAVLRDCSTLALLHPQSD
jgi:hypothetical protein